jgi:CDP-diacylglycerol--glycerol-3-phosphate 3-phosphatidyltransferase
MNLANQLTLGRFFLTVGFVISLTVIWPYSKSVGLVLFLVAGITDYLDGEVARRFNMCSDFGRLMDPLIDKIMIAAGFICLIPHGAIPPWAAVTIIGREFLITGLRLLALSKGRILSAEKLGKHKTAWQIITIIFFLALLAVREWAGATAAWDELAWQWGGAALLWLTVALTLISGLGYLWKNRTVIAVE